MNSESDTEAICSFLSQTRPEDLMAIHPVLDTANTMVSPVENLLCVGLTDRVPNHAYTIGE